MNLIPLVSLPGAITAILFSFLTTEPVTPEGAAPTAKPAAQEAFATIVEAVSDSERFWTAPYVLADLETKDIYILGEHAGMVPGEPLEFYLISEKSGHDYESLMISYALPSDIQKALEVLGLESVGPVDPDVHRFWPRGDRVDASFLHRGPEGNGILEQPAEYFCMWKGEPMPTMPWVFTGAPLLPSRENPGEQVFAPDEFGPNSIASTFNLRATVLDLPLQGTKTGIYGDFILNPDWNLGDGVPMVVRLKPADPERYPTEVDLTVSITSDHVTVSGIERMVSSDLAELGALLSDREGEVHFLTVDFGDDLRISDATARAREIQLLEQHVESIRIEPPPAGQVFFQSFVPDPRFRDRQQRPSQPIELHLNSDGAVVMELEEKWGDSRIPEVLETQVPLAQPEEWVTYLQNVEDRSSVLFLFAPEDASLADMRAWTQPVLELFPIVFVYKSAE